VRAGVDEGDPEVVTRAAHSIKGASANLGATVLAERAGELEALARARALSTAPELLDVLTAEFARVRLTLGSQQTVV
jgi:HPt (histidine-containing phosphotransfer) domain-containing protein